MNKWYNWINLYSNLNIFNSNFDYIIRIKLETSYKVQKLHNKPRHTSSQTTPSIIIFKIF